MALLDLISRRVPLDRGILLDDANSGREITFVTWDTLVTFPVASACITALWALAKALTENTSFFHTMLFPVIVAFVLGAIFYLAQLFDEKAADKTTKTRLLQVVPAFFNAVFLATATIGVDTVF